MQSIDAFIHTNCGKPMNIMIKFVASTATAFLLSGCLEGIEKVTLVQPGSQTGLIEIQNLSARDIVDVRAGPCCDSTGVYGRGYSDNVIEGRGAIAPGVAFQFPVTAGDYSVRVVLAAEGLLSGAEERFINVNVEPRADMKTAVFIR